MLSRKYYKIIAKCIKDNTSEIYVKSLCPNANSGKVGGSFKTIIDKDSLINDLCDEFKQDNSLFNRDTFTSACDVD